jgi:thymidylate synthase
MQTLTGRNVNQLWARAVPLIQQLGVRSPSRAGDVLVAPHPVMSVTTAPTERVLFDKARDANPFFHFFEALWMLNGRRDAAFLDTFVHDFGSRFAESNGNLYGAYGYRWRFGFDVDQLNVAVERLRKDPFDRRVVIAMWNPEDDCLEPDFMDDDKQELYPEPRDLPCNTHIYLRVRKVSGERIDEGAAMSGLLETHPDEWSVLDMTVCCRSNDIVWGAYGANAVHFSFLLEYLAGRIGVRVGTMYQLSNNWHAYVPVLERLNAKVDHTTKLFTPEPYSGGSVQPVPIGKAWDEWDKDLKEFMRWTKRPLDRGTRIIENQWFETTAKPLWRVHRAYRDGGDERLALRLCDDVAASDWALAARQWLERRYSKKAVAA